MESQGTRYGHALKIERGEEIIATLGEFAARAGVRAGALSGIGVAADLELGFFDPARREYVRRVFDQDHEIVGLMGNISEFEGRPYPHCHIVISGPDFIAYAGHLFRGSRWAFTTSAFFCGFGPIALFIVPGSFASATILSTASMPEITWPNTV